MFSPFSCSSVPDTVLQSISVFIDGLPFRADVTSCTPSGRVVSGLLKDRTAGCPYNNRLLCCALRALALSSSQQKQLAMVGVPVSSKPHAFGPVVALCFLSCQLLALLLCGQQATPQWHRKPKLCVASVCASADQLFNTTKADALLFCHLLSQVAASSSST